MKLLCLSNGHGEDAIAVRILQALQQLPNAPEIAALPIVGEGRAYADLGIPLIGSVKTMPSGGFIYMDGRQLARDIQGGLLQLTLAQIQAVRHWVRENGQSDPSRRVANSGTSALILAVGDLVPLLFAWLSGADYAFIGTAKSEYYVRDEAGVLPRRSWFTDRLERWSGSVYLPWERWLLESPRCKAVFARDRLTAEVLQSWSIRALDLGNPMMDGLEPSQPLRQEFLAEFPETQQPLTITLIPGSRPPEAYANWRRILEAVANLMAGFSQRQLIFLGAIAPGLDLESLCRTLADQGWQQSPPEASGISAAPALKFVQRKGMLILSQQAFNDFLHRGDFAIATAGTATEQFVGLGKPALILPGKGPQFTPAFAEAQTRLLGPSVTLLQSSEQATKVLQALLNDPDRLQLIAENGRRRMGAPGAAQRIAQALVAQLNEQASE